MNSSEPTESLKSSIKNFKKSLSKPRISGEQNDQAARYMQYVYLANDGTYRDKRSGSRLLTYQEYINKNQPWT